MPPRVLVPRLTVRSRVVAAAISLASLAVLIVARCLPPSPTGTGTHTALGMAPCQFFERTGLPCATCGMTTSFAQFSRGHLLGSFYLQPFGAVLAAAASLTFWAAGYCAATGKPAHRLLRRVPTTAVVAFALSAWIIGWAWKIWIVTSGRDGW